MVKKLLIVGLIACMGLGGVGCSNSKAEDTDANVTVEESSNTSEEVTDKEEVEEEKEEKVYDPEKEKEFIESLSEEELKVYNFFKENYEEANKFLKSGDVRGDFFPYEQIYEGAMRGVDYGIGYETSVHDTDNDPWETTWAYYNLYIDRDTKTWDLYAKEVRGILGLAIDENIINDIAENGFKFDDSKFKGLRDIMWENYDRTEQLKEVEEEITNFYKEVALDPTDHEYDKIEIEVKGSKNNEKFEVSEKEIVYTVNIGDIE